MGPRVLRCLFVFGLLAARAPGDDLAPVGSYEGKPIAQLRFDPPSQPVTRADLAHLVPFQPGTPLHLSDVRSAWIFMNNHFEGFAPESCQRFAKRLGFDLSLPSELQPTTSERGQLDLQL